jgi:hypothetical protein
MFVIMLDNRERAFSCQFVAIIDSLAKERGVCLQKGLSYTAITGVYEANPMPVSSGSSLSIPVSVLFTYNKNHSSYLICVDSLS